MAITNVMFKLKMSNNILKQKEIENRILNIRNTPVMIDRDLAVLYQTETRAVKQAVKRNQKVILAEQSHSLLQNRVWLCCHPLLRSPLQLKSVCVL